MVPSTMSVSFEHTLGILFVLIVVLRNLYYSARVSIITEPSFTPLGPYNDGAAPPENVTVDTDRLIDLRSFRVELQCVPCAPSSPLLLVLVASSPQNTERRAIIRAGWRRAAAGGAVRLVFLLGHVASQELQARLRTESDTHADLVQGSFVDAYRNMTYKHVMGLQWAARRCSGARFVLKSDDDVVVHGAALLHTLSRHLAPWGTAGQGLIACHVLQGARVERSHRSKWRASPAEYPARYYPSYCAGFAVVYDAATVRRLLALAQTTPYFWIDDVHVTGTLAERAFVTHAQLAPMELPSHTAHTHQPFLFSAPDLSTADMRSLWLSI